MLLCYTNCMNNHANCISVHQHWLYSIHRICNKKCGHECKHIYISIVHLNVCKIFTSSIGSITNDNRMYKLVLNNQIVAVPHLLVIYVLTNVENMVVTLLCLHTKPGQVSSQSVNHRGNNKSMCLPALKILMVLKVVCECHLYLLTHSVNLIVESVMGYCNCKEWMHFNNSSLTLFHCLKFYRLCSKGTRSASILSHCLAKWLTHRVHASIRFGALSLPFKQGKCIACEFMCSALVDSHSICVVE